jgi:uncharacterized protein (DUF39 family)
MSEVTLEALNEEVASAEPGVVAPSLTERIRERPLVSLGLAGLVGFVIGGGTSSRTGAAMLMLIARISLRRAAMEALASAMTSYGTAKRNGSGSSRTRTGTR